MHGQIIPIPYNIPLSQMLRNERWGKKYSLDGNEFDFHESALGRETLAYGGRMEINSPEAGRSFL
jgi:hypothetical protein